MSDPVQPNLYTEVYTNTQNLLGSYFHITTFDQTFQLNQNATVELIRTLDFSYNEEVIFDISQTDIRNMFFFWSEQNDLYDNYDSSDNEIRYYIDSTKFPINNNNIWNQSTVNTTVPIPQDFLQFLSYEFFKTDYGVSLFNNQNVVLYDLSSQLSNVSDNVNNLLNHFDISNTGLYYFDPNNNGYYKDASNNNIYYTTRDLSFNYNICRNLLDQIAYDCSGRLQNLPDYHLEKIPNTNIPATNLYSLPFFTGDKIVFKLTINGYPGNQYLITGEKDPNYVNTRIYKISIEVV
jgi:hypothetical protein